jgi:pimeloyl-ACP methyl ester carboxylesterase
MRMHLASLLLAVTTSVLAAPDYVREKRWADEIVPGNVVGDPVYLKQKNGHQFLTIYTEVANAKMGLVVVHGVGVHPDHGIIGTLRQRLPDYGYTTLSIQMPVLAAGVVGEAYRELFPEANERLQLAVDFLRSNGHRRIALVTHSLGTRMSHGYMIHNPASVAAWAALGAGTGPGPTLTYDGIRVPVLDLYGANELPRVLEGAAARRASLPANPASRQVVIADTDHFFVDREEEMVSAVRGFLDGIR